MSKPSKPVATSAPGTSSKPRLTLANIESIPGQMGYIVCRGNKIVHNTLPEEENPTQVAYNGIRLASRTNGPEFENHKPQTIQVYFEKFYYEMFQVGFYFVIVKKRLEDAEE